MRPCNGRHLLSRGTLRCGPGLLLLALRGRGRGRARPYGVGQLCTYSPRKPVARAELGVARVPAKPWKHPQGRHASKHPQGRQARRSHWSVQPACSTVRSGRPRVLVLPLAGENEALPRAARFCRRGPPGLRDRSPTASSKAKTGTTGGIDLVGATTGKVVVLGRHQNHSEIT